MYEVGSIIEFWTDFPTEEMAGDGKIMGGTALVVTARDGWVMTTALRRVRWVAETREFVIEVPIEEVKRDDDEGSSSGITGDGRLGVLHPNFGS